MKKFQITIMTLLAIVVGLIIYVRKYETYESTKFSDVLGEKIEKASNIRVTFLDIGQGDATFIEFPDGEQMLVDCSEDARVIEALGRVMEFYDKRIDYLLVTHPDSDHYGGCIDVLKRFDVGTIVYTGFEKQDGFFIEFMNAVQEEIDSGAQYREIDEEQVWDISSSTIQFLYPDHSMADDPTIPGTKNNDSNNSSIVFKLSFGDENLLMMGDAEEALEQYLLNTYGDQLNSKILKVGHHGSGSSSSQEFLDVVSPEYAVISVGANNSFGHPSLRVLRRLERSGSGVLRTDREGDILIYISPNSIYVP